ncbi:hypothetical protein Tco_0138692 [Tanacetum coccineum]
MQGVGVLGGSATKGDKEVTMQYLELKGGDRGACKLLGDVIEVLGCLLEGASCTQRKVSMVPFVFSIPFVLSWGGSISSDSFLPSILLLVRAILIGQEPFQFGPGDPVGLFNPNRLGVCIPPGQGVIG